MFYWIRPLHIFILLVLMDVEPLLCLAVNLFSGDKFNIRSSFAIIIMEWVCSQHLRFPHDVQGSREMLTICCHYHAVAIYKQDVKVYLETLT